MIQQISIYIRDMIQEIAAEKKTITPTADNLHFQSTNPEIARTPNNDVQR